jgi:hypothetical protein
MVEKRQPLQQMVLGKLDIHMQMTETRSLPFTLYQYQFKVDQYLNIRTKTLKLLQESKLEQPLWKAVWRFLKKLKTELLCDPMIPLQGIYLKECKSGYNRDTCTPMFTAALFTIAKLWNQHRCLQLMNGLRMWYLYTMECYSAIRKKSNYVVCK